MIRVETHLICVRCRHELENRAFNGFCSMLGPNLVLCPQCHESTPTDRSEWADMNWVGKLWYVFASLVYTIVMVFYGMTSGWCVMYFWFDAFGKTLGDSMATAIPGAILWGGLTIAVQFLRVRNSLGREPGKPVALPFWNLALGLQMKMLAGLFSIPIAAAILSFPVKWVVVGWGR
ncbi:hypothetical protein P12x_004695 [Tundrisphaera lichenicola]|uniref:hypothetical protein n=1 Tax=Tundrisphaera lichenicola TaxID=2029860 RepID=UPI003EC025FD